MAILTLSDEQTAAKNAAIAYIRSSRLEPFVINGLAGTGKTTLLASIAAEYPQAHLCTLTGKAASILRRKTGLPACTIHSAFYKLLDVRKDPVTGRRVPSFTRAYDEDGALAGGIILLDEHSMVSHEMALDLIRTGARIIACGDPGQLPPVKGVAFFSRADITLKTIHRQALESPIIRQAHRIRAGMPYETDGAGFQVFRRVPTADEYLNADAVLCYTNRTRHAVNTHVRSLRGYWQTAPVAGETVICLRNVADYGIFNGATYLLEQDFVEGDTEIHINVEDEIVSVPRVEFEGVRSGLADDEEPLTSFGYGYAMTVHKAQGSEWDRVLLIDEYRRAEHRREWLYTAVTRAADHITIVR